MNKNILLITLLFTFCYTNAQNINRNPYKNKGEANVWWDKNYTLFDFVTDEPIFPIYKNGVTIYPIYYSSNEDPNPYYGEFTTEKMQSLLFYKFKNLDNCMKFCNSKKIKNKSKDSNCYCPKCNSKITCHLDEYNHVKCHSCGVDITY